MNKKIKDKIYKRYYLFARPSFLEGVSRVLDIGGTLQEYNVVSSGKLADYYALRSDLFAVAEDFKLIYEKEEKTKQQTT